MITIEKVCEQIYKNYKRCGYPGIGGIGDVGEEWVFVQAPEKKDGELPIGDSPVFVNKKTGKTRSMVFDVPDITSIKNATQINVPERFRPVY